MRTLRAFAFAASFAAGLVAAADENNNYFGIALTGGGLTTPKQTANSDLSSFRSGGFALVLGHDFGRMRLEGEWLLQGAAPTGNSAVDEIDFGTLMASAWFDFEPTDRLVLSLGLGLGGMRANVDTTTCFDPGGCGLLSPVVHDEGRAGAVQTMLSASWRCAQDLRLVFGLRHLASGDLGLVNENGVPFYDGRLAADLATIALEFTY